MSAQSSWPYGLGPCGAEARIGYAALPDDLIVSMYEGGTNLFVAERYGAKLGSMNFG